MAVYRVECDVDCDVDCDRERACKNWGNEAGQRARHWPRPPTHRFVLARLAAARLRSWRCPILRIAVTLSESYWGPDRHAGRCSCWSCRPCSCCDTRRGSSRRCCSTTRPAAPGPLPTRSLILAFPSECRAHSEIAE